MGQQSLPNLAQIETVLDCSSPSDSSSATYRIGWPQSTYRIGWPQSTPLQRCAVTMHLDSSVRVSAVLAYGSSREPTARQPEASPLILSIYVGTFSKTLSPALRVGFLVAPRNLILPLRAIRQVIDWCPPLATQAALAELITGGYLDRHLRRSRAVYRERHRLLREALGQLLPARNQLLPAQAGLHIAIVRPELPADRHVRSVLERRGLQIGSLRRTYHFSDPAPGFLVGFGALPTESIFTACRIFAQALQEVELADHRSNRRRQTVSS
jgi:hypothetical protein